MTNWNIPKIREECLKLMGWGRVPGLGSLRGVWFGPDGEGDPPDPTTSLDHALPLIEKYGMAVAPPNVADALWLAQVIHGYPNVARLAKADSPCLAICLCALRCDGRDLDEFKVKP